MPKTVIYAVTQNIKKLDEYKKQFDLYGIAVEATEKLDETLLYSTDKKVLAIIREESNIFDLGGNVSEQKHLEVVLNRAKLEATYLRDGVVCIKEYTATIEGFINKNKRTENGDVFDWDDIFETKSTGLTLHELKRRGVKNSARDRVLGDFISDFIHYSKHIDLRYSPQNQVRTIDFSNRVKDFIDNNTLLSNPNNSMYGLKSILNYVLNNGLFFRSPSNRREKNYWLPGLNAGVPLVPKSDDVHEVTFMFHDFMHFLIPDLLFDGVNTGMHKSTYVLYRMMSEAITLCLADMLFIDTLKKSGIDYDFTKRKIYPLFEHLGIGTSEISEAGLETLLHANMRYALFSDDSEFKDVITSDTGLDALEEYKAKYSVFFSEDFRWTRKNYDLTNTKSAYIGTWLKSVEPLLTHHSISSMNTISEFIKVAGIGSKDPDDVVAEKTFSVVIKRIKEIIAVGAEYNERVATTSMAVRYFIGQCGIFAKFHFLPESTLYQEKIVEYIGCRDVLTEQDFDILRNFYTQYVNILFEKQLISKHDHSTFKEVYPLFDPFYVSY